MERIIDNWHSFRIACALLIGWMVLPNQVEAQWLSLHSGVAQNYVRAIAVNDSDGRVVVIGKIRFPVTLENGLVLGPRTNNCCLEIAMYGAIYSVEGELLSAEIIEDHSPDTGQTAYGFEPLIFVGDVEWLPEGDYLIAGYMVGRGPDSSYITLGTRPNHIELASNNGAAKTFVARFNSDHQLVWAKELRYVPEGGGRYMRTALAPDGGIYVTGWPLLTKLDQNGDREWEFFHTLDGNAYSVVAEESRVCVAGEKGEGAAITCLTHGGDVINEMQLRETPNSSGKVQVLDMSLDNDTLFIAGYVRAATLDYQTSVAPIEGFTDVSDHFVAAIDGGLNAVQWARALPSGGKGKSPNSVPRVNICGKGTLYVAGTFDEAWEHSAAEQGAFSKQRPGSFFLQLDRSGEVLAATSIRSTGGDIWLNGVDCLSESELAVVGEFKWEMNFNQFGQEPLIRYAPEQDDGFLMTWSFSGGGIPVLTDDPPSVPEKWSIESFPNPASNLITVRMSGLVGQGATATIFDALGRSVSVTEMSLSGAQYHWKLDTSQWPLGVYFVLLEANGKAHTHSFVVHR
jgi:hypothetical protein